MTQTWSLLQTNRLETYTGSFLQTYRLDDRILVTLSDKIFIIKITTQKVKKCKPGIYERSMSKKGTIYGE